MSAFFILVAGVNFSFAQIKFQKTIGTKLLFAVCINNTSDGGYILGCNTGNEVTDSLDIVLVKTNDIGTITWAKEYVSPGNDYLSYCEQTSDGGYILTGSTHFASSTNDILVIKTTGTGNVSWQKIIGGPFGSGSTYNGSDIGGEIHETADGGFVMGAAIEYSSSQNDGYLAKFSSSGSIDWEKDYGSSNYEQISSVSVLNDGYAFCGGYQEGAWMGKTDLNGAIVWQKLYHGSHNETAARITGDASGNLYAAGNTQSFSSGSTAQGLIVKLSPTGTKLFAQRYGTSYCYLQHIFLTPDGNAIATGDLFYDFVSGNLQSLVMKVNGSSGGLLWANEEGPVSIRNGSVKPGGDLAFIKDDLNAQLENKIRFIRADANGASGCYETDTSFNGTSTTFSTEGNAGSSLRPNSNGHVYTIASIAVVDLSLQGQTECFSNTTGITNDPVDESEFEIFPVPAGEILSLSFHSQFSGLIELTDGFGKTVESFLLSKNKEVVQLNVGSLSSGIYFLKTYSDKGVVVKEFVVQH